MLATQSSTETRTCRGPCGRTLPLTDEHFQVLKVAVNGAARHRWQCVDCRRAYQREVWAGRTRPATTPRDDAPVYLPAKPLGDRVHEALRAEARRRGETYEERVQVFGARLGMKEAGRSIYAWRHERRSVTAVTAYEALDAVDLQLIDAYPKQLLKRVLPKV